MKTLTKPVIFLPRKLLSMLAICLLFVACKKTVINNYIVNPSNYASGLLQTPPSTYSNIPVATLPPSTGGSLPSSYFIEIPSIPFNQGNQGSCASCASAMAKSIVDHVKKTIPYSNNMIIYSPSYLFNQVNVNPNDCPKGGSYLYANFDILKLQGVCKLTDMQYNETDCITQPSSGQRTLAAPNKIDHYFRLDPINTSTIKQFISIGLPVIVAFKVDNHFTDDYWDPNNANKVWKSFGTYSNSNHATLLYGWDDSKNAFKMLNQWGNLWGNNGSIWVDYNLVSNINVFYEAYILQNPSPSNINDLQVTGDLNFGNTIINSSAGKTIQLTNNGTTSINVSGISITAPFSTNWASGIIQAGATQAVTITFNPTIIGNASSTLTINSNATNSPVIVQASGNGIQQPAQTRIISLTGNLSFGNVTVGQTSSRTLTISNTGNTTLNVSSLTIPQGFSGSWSGPIPANSSVNTSITFQPSNAQIYTGNIAVNSDATSGVSTINVSGTGVLSPTRVISLSGNLSFGNVTVGQTSSRTLTISNTGNTTLNVSSLTIPQGFSGSWSGPILANSSVTTSITFQPSNAQIYTGNIAVNSDATSGTSTINVSGTGVLSPTRIISLSGNLSFGNVTVGQTSSRTLTISNTGNTTLNVSSLNIPQGFSGSWSGPILANSSVTTSITFQPSNAQIYTGNIAVNSDATSGTSTINVSGTGISSGPVSVPAIGTYAACAAVGSYNCPPLYGLGTINAKIVSINTSTHQIVIEIKKCDGTAFNAGGNLNVVNLLCGGTGAVSYGFGSFSAGSATVQLTITDNNMVGSKAYVPFIIQGASLNIYYSAPAIVVTY